MQAKKLQMKSMIRPPYSSIFCLKRIIFFAFILICAIELPSLGLATTYYVATNGNDAYAGLSPAYEGGSNGPFRTINRAALAVKAGDTVQVRGGTYQAYSTWMVDGTEVNPITITNYNGEAVVIDGNNHTIPGGANDVLLQIYGDWYTVRNLEVRYSGGSGVAVHGYHCTVDNVYAHHNWGAGIYITGWYGLINNCRAYSNSMMNENYTMPISWAFGISACRYPQHTTIRGCTSWDNWGEGISTFESYYITIEDCISYNNQCNFYLSDTKYCLFQRNLAYCTPGNPIQPYVVQANISLGDEGRVPASSDNTVINNLALGAERNFVAGGTQLVNGLVAHNTFVNAVETGGSECTNVYFHAGTATGCQFKNNIILQEDSTTISHLEATAISFGYNNWSRIAVNGCKGTGDVIGDPKIAKTGSIGAGVLTPACFKIMESSPARDRAEVLNEVTEDYFRTLRGSTPEIGAFNISDGTSSLMTSATGSPTTGQAPLTVNFTGSASGGTTPYSYEWTFGDGGSSTSQNPSHTYASVGSYIATLSVVDNTRATASSTVNVIIDATANMPLSANIGASPIIGQAPLTVNFTGSASGGTSPYSYKLTFGDGGSSTSQNPSHTYASVGSYTAILTVTDNASATASSAVSVIISAPVNASLSANYVTTPTSGRAPLSVHFAGSASGGTPPYSYRWTFSEGGSSKSQNPSHTYASVGSYTVTLTVRDSSSRNVSTTMSVTVRTVSDNLHKNPGQKIVPQQKLLK